MHEVVTLQFGQQANYVGTHYWNTQESYFTYTAQEESPVDHDISFRPGIGADGSDTYTPRTLIYDLKGAFGTLRRENALYELQDREAQIQQNPWSGSTIPLRLPAVEESAYQQALNQGLAPPSLSTASVRFWSDYNHLFYHPRSIVQLQEYELNSTLMPFERWSTGEELFANLDREHDLLDRDLRPFLEECDQLQGIQIFTGTDDAWGGFAARYLERVADELGKGSRWVFGLEDGRRVARERQVLQTANIAQSLYSITPSSSLYIPLTSLPAKLLPYVSLDAASQWHTSALQIAAIETLTLPSRLRTSEAARATFDGLEAALTNDGKRQLASLSYSVENPANLGGATEVNGSSDERMANGHANGFHEDDEADLDIDLHPPTSTTTTRGPGRRAHTFSSISSLRGYWKSTLELEESNTSARDPFHSGPRTNLHQMQLLFPILSSYPQIFNFSHHPEKLAVQSSLSTSTVVADRIRSVEAVARRVVGLDEREALCDGLVSMAEEYEEGWSGSESGGEDQD